MKLFQHPYSARPTMLFPSPVNPTESPAFQRALPSASEDIFSPQVRFGEQYGKHKIWSFNEDKELAPATSNGDEVTPHDVEEYLLHPGNYGSEKLLAEDKEIIEKLIQSFTVGGLFSLLKKSFQSEIDAGGELRLANVGHADLYPALLLTGVAKAFNTENYKIDLIDYIRASREVLYRSLYGTQLADMPFQELLWNKYRDFMEERGGALWSGRLNDLRQNARIVQGDMRELPENRYHAIFSFFSADSITSSISEFDKAIHSLVSSVKPGGLVAGALMSGSEGWSMGKSWMPGIPLTKAIVENAFKDAGAYVEVKEVDAPPQIRDGYDGMLVYTGIRRLEDVEPKRDADLVGEHF